jgi:bis(5'-nucleosyl)-tetraphosphatase (symmetrical)
MAVYAIGDVQGCFEPLQQLLKKIKFKSDCDQLLFCGDLVNRGPDSLKTLRFIKSLGSNANSVLGNHDLHLLACAYLKNKPKKTDTFNDVLAAKDAEILLNWLRHRPLALYYKKHKTTLIHAGIHPKWGRKKTFKLAKEVEALLQSDKHISFYQNMYGNFPDHWEKNLTGMSRYRFITNVLTRLRYCDVDGKLALNEKGAPNTAHAHLLPWYLIPQRKTENKKIIFGHWSTLPHAGKKIINNSYAIDSGCLWGCALTALRIDVQPFEFIRLNCEQIQSPVKFIHP